MEKPVCKHVLCKQEPVLPFTNTDGTVEHLCVEHAHNTILLDGIENHLRTALKTSLQQWSSYWVSFTYSDWQTVIRIQVLKELLQIEEAQWDTYMAQRNAEKVTYEEALQIQQQLDQQP